MPELIRVSVRSLVEYVFRSGSIETGFRTGTALTEGTKAHQKLQKEYKGTDMKEVQLQAEVAAEELVFLLEGRCDGLLFSDNGEVTVEEIKSTAQDVDRIEEDMYPVHWAQAKCYAYMYAITHGMDRMHVQLTYVQVETQQRQSFRVTLNAEELTAFAQHVVRGFAPYAALLQRLGRERNLSVKALQFPFESYREGQRRLAGTVYKTIEAGKSLFAKAPTGTGKTISTLFPAIKAIGEGLVQRIFYITAKTITRTAAEEAFSLMEAGGLRMKVVTITAKDKVCFKDETNCTKEYCEFADGYYDRINGAMLDILTNETALNRTTIERYARKHRVCPFEFSLDLAYAADAVICDYNYIFDPRVSLKRLFEEQKKQTVLLVDEAHNLLDRAREMFSAALEKSPFLQLKRAYKTLNPAVGSASQGVNDYFIALRKQGGDNKYMQFREPRQDLAALLDPFLATAEKELLTGKDGETHRLLLDTYFSVQAYVRISKLYDERYITYVELERNEVRIKQLCLDPSHLLRQTGKGYRAKIHFSATLSPLPFYKDMLGGDEEDYAVSIPSPFSKEQLEVIVRPLSTRFRDREATREALTEMLRKLTAERAGNYLVFFPSFEYMNAVVECFAGGEPDLDISVQRTSMTEDERELFLTAFQQGNERTLVGFAVMGGIFSEGIDLVGDRLSGVVVVGVGMPQLGLERDLMKDYFDGIGKNGFDYAYVYPGMNKVLQAGGRLIRSERDRGVLMLVDDRFLQPKYQRLLPEEWRDYTVIR